MIAEKRNLCFFFLSPATHMLISSLLWCSYLFFLAPATHRVISSPLWSSHLLWPCLQVAAAIILVQLRKCVIGEVEATPETCVACLANTYSLNSTDQSCYACPPNANCTGGADLVPLQQYWHSAPDSDFMVSCPNSNACKGDREELLSCKAAAYAIQAGQPAVRCSRSVCPSVCLSACLSLLLLPLLMQLTELPLFDESCSMINCWAHMGHKVQ